MELPSLELNYLKNGGNGFGIAFVRMGTEKAESTAGVNDLKKLNFIVALVQVHLYVAINTCFSK